MDAEDVSFILKTTLRREFLEDPNVLKFIYSYLRNRDVRQASKEAGIHVATGHALRRRKDVVSAITKVTECALHKYNFDASDVVEKVKEIVNVDIAEFQNPDGSFKDNLHQIPAEVRRAIKKFKAKNLYDFDANGMKVVVGRMIEVELWDKMKGAQMLGSEKGIFKETKVIEHDVTANMKEVLLESRERAEKAAMESRQEHKTIEITGKVVDDQGTE